MVLEGYASSPVNLAKVLRMLVVHDVVEIDAGDTFAYDAAGNATKEERERRAADRIFGCCQPGSGKNCAAMEEFDAAATPEARFANAVDRVQPFLQNRETGEERGTPTICQRSVLARMDPVRTPCPSFGQPYWRPSTTSFRGSTSR